MASSSSRAEDGRLHLRLDPTLKRWLKEYARKRARAEGRKINATMIIEGLLVNLRKQDEAPDAEQL